MKILAQNSYEFTKFELKMHDQKYLRDTLYEKHYGKLPTVYILL